MKKKLLSLMLLLCALIVGSGTMWATDVTYKLELVYTDFSTTSYAANNGSHSKDAVCTTDASKKMSVSYTTNQIMQSGSAIQWQKSKGYIYNTTNLGTISSVTVTSTAGSFTTYYGTSEQPTSGTAGSGKGYFKTSVGSATGTASKIEVVFTVTEGGGSSAAATTTTITSSGITNTDLKNGTTAGSLSASVTSGGAEVPGATVTWSGDNDAVATINASTGVVTLVGEGTVNFTASYAGEEDTYAASSSEYEMTVTDTRYTVSDLTFTAAYGSGPGTADDDAEWTVTSDGTESNFDNTSGIHYGTGSAYVTYVQLSTSDIKGVIKKVKVNTRDAQASGSVTVSVGGSAFNYGENTSVTATNTSTEYTFTGSGKGQIIVRVDRGSSQLKAIYVKSVKVYYEPSTDPAISASDVDITYDATGGTIDYTLENATGNVSATVTTGSDWLTLGTITEDEVPFTCDANTGAERTATVTLSFSGADDKVVTVTQAASPARYTTIPALFAGATTTATDVLVTFNNWVVSAVSTNGKNVFVTDNNGNGFVIYNSEGGLENTYAVGNILSGTAVPCSLKKTSGYAQLTGVSGLTITTGGTVSTANIAMASLAGVNTGALVSYENLVCSTTTSNNNTYYYLSDGNTTLQVYNALYAFGSTLESGHKYNVTGIYQQYGETKELLPRSSADIVEVFTPAISATPASLTGFTYEVDNGPSTTKTISVSGTNLTANITLSLGNNSDFEMCLTENGTYTNSLTLTQSAGAVAATTVYVRLKADLAIGNSYSGTITLTSTGATDATVSLSGSVTEPVVDYVTLPFSFNNGKSNLVAGLSQNGLGTDYASSSAPNTQLKFDGTGDYLILKLGNNDDPGMLSFETKSNGFSGGTFTVQTSVNGSDYTDLMYYDETTGHYLGSVDNFILSPSVRYIKWIYTEKSSGNVGLGNIQVSKRENVSISSAGYATFCSTSPLNFTEEDGIYAYTASVNGENISFERTYKVPANTGVLLYSINKEAVSASVPVLLGNPSEISTNLFVAATTEIASLASEANNCTNYILNNGSEGIGFYLANGHRVGAGKAYLAVPNNAGIRGFIGFDFSDPTTGIAVVKDELQQTEGAYDLQGRRVSEPKNGLYIVNGKKVLVK